MQAIMSKSDAKSYATSSEVLSSSSSQPQAHSQNFYLPEDILGQVPSLDWLVDSGVSKVVVLDFDGVVNTFALVDSGKKYYTTNHLVYVPNPYFTKSSENEPVDYLIRWSDNLVSEINSLVQKEDTALVWLTTWKQYAGTLSKMIGIEPYGQQFYLNFGDSGENHPSQSSKNPAMENWLADSAVLQSESTSDHVVKIVWVDDTVLCGSYAGQVKDMFDNHLMTVAPKSMKGISTHQMNQMKKFLSNH